MRKFYRWIAISTIIIFPISFYGLFMAYVIAMGKYAEYENNFQFKKAAPY